MKVYTVYKHINKINGKIYIGITSQSVNRRWKQGYKYCTAFQNALNKYGWDGFVHQIITSNLTKDEACAMEVALITAYKATDSEYGYNIMAGGTLGNSGISPSSETRKKLSESNAKKWKDEKYHAAHSGENAYWYGKKHSEETLQKIKNHHPDQSGSKHPMYGKKHTDEAKKKMSAAKIGKNTRGDSPKAKPVLQYDLNGNFVREYGCIIDAEQFLENVHASNIKKCIDGIRITCGGYMWKYKNSKKYPLKIPGARQKVTTKDNPSNWSYKEN